VVSDRPKNPHAVALGRLGGIKSGRTRAKKVGVVKVFSEVVNAGVARMAKLTKEEKHALAMKGVEGKRRARELREIGLLPPKLTYEDLMARAGVDAKAAARRRKRRA
jgi:hypothetical protein